MGRGGGVRGPGWGKRAGLSFVRGFARYGVDSCGAAPLLSPSRGRGFPSSRGARGAWAACACWAERPAPGLPRSERRRSPSFAASASNPLRRRPLPLRFGSLFFPAPAPAPPPPSSPGRSASCSLASRGAARAGRGGAAAREGGEERPASPALQQRRAYGAGEEGSPPPGPSEAFCSQPEVCTPGP